VADQGVVEHVERNVREAFGASTSKDSVHDVLMLGRAFRDEGETPTGSLCPVAEEHFAAVGILTALADVFVDESQVSQLTGNHLTKIESRAIAGVDVERFGGGGEVRRDFGTYLITLARDAGTNKRVHLTRVGEMQHRTGEDATGQSAPARVHDAKARRRRINQKDRRAVSDQHGQRDVRASTHEPIAFSLDARAIYLDDDVAMNLRDGDQPIGFDPDGFSHATTILFHVFVLITNVPGQIE
jgi:hypothetical protein